MDSQAPWDSHGGAWPDGALVGEFVYISNYGTNHNHGSRLEYLL